jgi:hypothetical protein
LIDQVDVANYFAGLTARPIRQENNVNKWIILRHADVAEHLAVGPFDDKDQAEDFLADRLDGSGEVLGIVDRDEWLDRAAVGREQDRAVEA